VNHVEVNYVPGLTPALFSAGFPLISYFTMKEPDTLGAYNLGMFACSLLARSAVNHAPYRRH